MQSNKFDSWAIVDIMGHQRLAGRVTEETIGGVSLLRCDIPEVNGIPAWTTYLTAGSLYQMTPVTEEIARTIAEKLCKQPISLYDLPEEWRDKIRRAPVGLPSPRDVDLDIGVPSDDDDDDYEDDDEFSL